MKVEKVYEFSRAGREIKIVFHQGYYLLVYEDADRYASVICEELAQEYEIYETKYFLQMCLDKGLSIPEWDDSDIQADKVIALREGRPIKAIEGEFEIPSHVAEDYIRTISFIEEKAFLNCDKLTKICMPDTIKSIGKQAFKGCTNLEEILLSKGLRKIAANVFDDTAFYRKESNWTDGALYLDKWLIKVDSKVEGEFIVRKGTVGIANGAFKGCKKLQAVQFPHRITKTQRQLSGWRKDNIKQDKL